MLRSSNNLKKSSIDIFSIRNVCSPIFIDLTNRNISKNTIDIRPISAIGLFNKNISITSTNRESFTIPFDSPLFGNRGEMSAAIQRAGWANQGYVPGDKSEIPMNYYKICELIGVDARFRESFNCVIHRDEIEYIINKLNRIKSTDINNEETNLFKYNLMSLLSSESTEPWLRVPAINLFESGKKLFLN